MKRKPEMRDLKGMFSRLSTKRKSESDMVDMSDGLGLAELGLAGGEVDPRGPSVDDMMPTEDWTVDESHPSPNGIPERVGRSKPVPELHQQYADASPKEFEAMLRAKAAELAAAGVSRELRKAILDDMKKTRSTINNRMHAQKSKKRRENLLKAAERERDQYKAELVELKERHRLEMCEATERQKTLQNGLEYANSVIDLYLDKIRDLEASRDDDDICLSQGFIDSNVDNDLNDIQKFIGDIS